ncbi:hypothetical protein SOMG_03158 [Schizosaccharomyces osmophilus]|uniref:Uncharacterized protein n=1 Tax=Schizosaccharomyces osmophilus TaxID=2545709 RepID=A0AAE9WDU2_9SCHI|nr:uncharacterized protein SOMG_03158 [Schizosaccharomyces osmophilus]WBW74053.1 hypothetical protein SOMG_03158 [Schizosaccharomyces osmophilus]
MKMLTFVGGMVFSTAVNKRYEPLSPGEYELSFYRRNFCFTSAITTKPNLEANMDNYQIL